MKTKLVYLSMMLATCLFAVSSTHAQTPAGVIAGSPGTAIIPQVWNDLNSKGLVAGFWQTALINVTPTPSGTGFYQHYQGQYGVGSIYYMKWKANPNGWGYGTYIYGAIRDSWSQLGWENNKGYPITPEQTIGTPPGPGPYRFIQWGCQIGDRAQLFSGKDRNYVTVNGREYASDTWAACWNPSQGVRWVYLAGRCWMQPNGSYSGCTQ